MTESLYPLNSKPPSPPPPAATTPLSGWGFVADPSCTWNHVESVFLWLAVFTQYNIFKARPRGGIWQEFLLLWLNSIPLSKYTKHFLHPLICQQTCWLLPYFTIWIMLQKTWEGRQFFEVPISFVWDIPWSGVAGWCGSPISISSNF